MITKYYPAKDAGKLDYGWLTSYYSFNFETMQEFEKIRFGQMRILNNDTIKGGTGFGRHSHENMEIITIPLSGGLLHEDSLGNSHKIIPGDVQTMTAGTGIVHSEKNLYDDLETNFLQIWVFPDKKGLQPRYQQQSFGVNHMVNTWELLVAPQGFGPLYINQSAYFSRVNLTAHKEIKYTMHKKNNGVLFYIINGEMEVNSEIFRTRDAVGYGDVNQILIKASKDTDVLAMEVPLAHVTS